MPAPVQAGVSSYHSNTGQAQGRAYSDTELLNDEYEYYAHRPHGTRQAPTSRHHYADVGAPLPPQRNFRADENYLRDVGGGVSGQAAGFQSRTPAGTSGSNTGPGVGVGNSSRATLSQIKARQRLAKINNSNSGSRFGPSHRPVNYATHVERLTNDD
jgi:hypothetical protein